jgi:hypothetical protein
MTVMVRFVTGHQIELYSKYWLCNKTGLQVRLSSPGLWSSWPPAEALGVGGFAGVCTVDFERLKGATIAVAVGASATREFPIQKLRQGRPGDLVSPHQSCL